MPEGEDQYQVVGGVHRHHQPDGVHPEPHRSEEHADQDGLENLVADSDRIGAGKKEVVEVAEAEEARRDHHPRAEAERAERFQDDTAVSDLLHKDVDQQEADLESEHQNRRLQDAPCRESDDG